MKFKYHNFKILVKENIFSYLVNDVIILSVRQLKPIIDYGKLALILWDTTNSNIDVTFKNIKIYNNL